jgi:hypothetical protein
VFTTAANATASVKSKSALVEATVNMDNKDTANEVDRQAPTNTRVMSARPEITAN